MKQWKEEKGDGRGERRWMAAPQKPLYKRSNSQILAVYKATQTMWACTYGIDRWIHAKLVGYLTATLVDRMTAWLVDRMTA